ncbi:RNA polymerase sigma factor [Acidiferrimicrobium sp. IK]|uniref:RNA polymerase sigma factor n=1 Tax=Acidiferrimicrobium sp. IK TaxID=2871700 RepID=UPI0021CB8D0A|nr:RNA polymerase sigma factor [Acidiferrimicrobium sp. IK]MCU4186319.1 RNA polymerase sigma factor [Acidiferrimicrobium sp. IK]
MSLPPFEVVVTEHGATVLRICRAMVGAHDADDVWSETFLAALGAYPRLEPGSNVRGWLATIAHRKAIDHIRKLNRSPLPVDPPPEALVLGAEPEVGDEDLWNAVVALPTKQRGAVVYHYLAGLPYAEVGQLLDSSEAAARRAAADGMRALRSTVTRETS